MPNITNGNVLGIRHPDKAPPKLLDCCPRAVGHAHGHADVQHHARAYAVKGHRLLLDLRIALLF